MKTMKMGVVALASALALGGATHASPTHAAKFSEPGSKAATASGTGTIDIKLSRRADAGVRDSKTAAIKNAVRGAADKPEVCAMLYVWYGYNGNTGAWTGGLGSSHWDSSAEAMVKDVPQAGYYASMKHIPMQLRQMSAAGINCAVVSWWGYGVDKFSDPNSIDFYNASINAAAKEVFTAAEGIPGFKVALLVDAFADSSTMSSADYGLIYSYVRRNFYRPYADEVLQWNGKPLLMWFNPMSPPSDPHFSSRVMGAERGTISKGWSFWSAPQRYFEKHGGMRTESMAYYLGQTVSPDGFISVTPRFDNYYGFKNSGRSDYMRVDPKYSMRLYQNEWDYVIAQQRQNGNVKLVLIYSWNEYHERSEIEPHRDFTARTVGKYYLYNITKAAIARLDAINANNQG